MATACNGMTLETQINQLPKGPVRWGWFESGLDIVAKALRIISPRQTLRIFKTASGYSFTVIQPPDEPEETTAWLVSSNGRGAWNCFGGGLISLNQSGFSYNVEDKTLSASDGKFICLRVAYDIGYASTATPIFNTAIPSGALTFQAIELVAATSPEITWARLALPQSSRTGEIYIPLAAIDGGNARMLVGTTDLELLILHNYFLVVQ